MSSRIALGLALVAAIAACAGDTTGPNSPAVPANGLLISAAVPGRCLVGGCDPVSSDENHLGLVTLTNTGINKVFFELCGAGAAINEQQFVGGQWVNVGPAYACAAGPVSQVIVQHDSVQFNMWFGAGTFRLLLGAASDTTLTTIASSTSAAIVIK